MRLNNFYIFYILTILWESNCETTQSTTTETLLKTYKNYLSAYRDLNKSDRNIMKNWTTDFQVQLVNVTSHYRLEMTRHKEHNFLFIKSNSKWNDCIDLHQNEINNAEKSYYTEESRCLKQANADEGKKRHSVYQMEKEIRKWRKSYNYLVHQCNQNNPEDEEAAGMCLVEYMQKDNYHITFQRLILLKLESMSDLYSQMVTSVHNCEDCLKGVFLSYLNNVRTIMNSLNHCYKLKKLIA